MITTIDVDKLAQEIRRVDGSHSLGAGALAEALMPFLRTALETATNAALEKAAVALAAAPYSNPSDVEETGLFSIPTTRKDLIAIVLTLKTKETPNADR